MKGVSIVICCYNSGERLIQTLCHLAKQKRFEGIGYELVIIDNNSSDNTVLVASKAWNALGNPFPCLFLFQPIPGLKYAKDLGIQTANYDYIVMCDDDNWLCETYSSKVYQLFESMPHVVAIGGVGEPIFDGEPPNWFQRVGGFGYAIGDEGRETGLVESVYGAGMSIRKSIYIAITNVYQKSVLTGRMGDNLSSGEDTELCLLFRKAGYDIYLDKSLSFKHFLAQKRLNWTYYMKLRMAFGKAAAYLLLYNEEPSPIKIFCSEEGRLNHLILLIRLIASDPKYFFFPRLFKNKSCGHFIQRYSMLKTIVAKHKILQRLSNEFINKNTGGNLVKMPKVIP